MTVRKQELYNVVEALPEELSNKVLEYIEYLKYTDVINTRPLTTPNLTKHDYDYDDNYTVTITRLSNEYAGYNSDRDSMLVEVKKTLFFKPNQIEYHLGKVLEYDIKKKTSDRLGIK